MKRVKMRCNVHVMMPLVMRRENEREEGTMVWELGWIIHYMMKMPEQDAMRPEYAKL